MSKVAGVHPFVTLFSLMLFGGLSGFLGILLAVGVQHIHQLGASGIRTSIRSALEAKSERSRSTPTSTSP